MTDNELAACPFCGPGELQTFRLGSIHFVQCVNCDIERTGRTEAEAIAAWNQRPKPDSTPDVREANDTEAMRLLREVSPKLMAHALDTPHGDERAETYALIARIDRELAGKGGV